MGWNPRVYFFHFGAPAAREISIFRLYFCLGAPAARQILKFPMFFALVCLQHAIFLGFVSIFCLGTPVACPDVYVFFATFWGASRSWRVMFFFSRRWPELTCYVFFFAGFCKFGRNYRVMFFFRGHLRKIITLWFFEALRKKKHNTSK